VGSLSVAYLVLPDKRLYMILPFAGGHNDPTVKGSGTFTTGRVEYSVISGRLFFPMRLVCTGNDSFSCKLPDTAEPAEFRQRSSP